MITKYRFMTVLSILSVMLMTTACQKNEKLFSGMKYANTSVEQQDLAYKLRAEHPDAVVDPASGYVVCGDHSKAILAEPLVRITMCDHTITAKDSYIKSLQAANDNCMKTKNVCIKVFSSLRSNISSQIARNKMGGSLHNAIAVECTSSHNIGQAFDILNFADAHECLLSKGFNGGWSGVLKNPSHYSKLEHGSIPFLTEMEATKRKAENTAWCLSNEPCRRNNLAKQTSQR